MNLMKNPVAVDEALSKLNISDLNLPEVFARALVSGGVLAECFFERSASTRVVYENQKVDKVTEGIDEGVGLRIIFDHRSVYGYTTDLSQDAVNELADALSAAVTEGGEPPVLENMRWQQARASDLAIENYWIKKSPRDVSLQDKIALTKRMNLGARQVLPDARQVMVQWLDTQRDTLVINSDGLIAPARKCYLSLYVQVVGERDGRVESSMDSDGGFVGMEFFDEKSPEEIGATQARRVLTLLEAKPAPAGTMPVVISSQAGGTMIHEAVGHGLEADLACNGLSVYQGKIGQQVASERVTVVDDGSMPEKRGSFVFDDEGTPSRKNVLIENGILKSYMVDKISAMKFDLMATGNGRRESFRHKPIVRMSNTYVQPGNDDPEKILQETEKGIFVKAMGGGQVNTVTGDFVFAVTEGYLIENGRLGAPIRGATLVGNGPKVLKIVDRVGSDLGWDVGTCGKDGQGAPVTDAQPTLRIPELTVGGEVPMDKYWK